jgi:hypothetical protein
MSDLRKINHMRKIILSAGVTLAFLLLYSACSKKDNPKPAPTLESISQNPISPGGSFTITGANFDLTAANNSLMFGTTAVTVTSSTATTLTATLPQNFMTGSYQVSVTVNNMTAKLSASVDVTPNAPSITSFTPTSGPAGTVVTVTGTNFDTTPAENVLTLGSSTTPVAVTAATATSLTFAIPTGTAVGSYALHITIKQNNESSSIANSATSFNVLPPTPTITGFTPATAAEGATVTITGTNFSATTANNIVKFGTTTATVSAATATQLTTTVPSGLTIGTTYPVSVAVTANSLTSATATSQISFIEVPPTPTITSFTPAQAAQGASVTLVGTNFNTTIANNSVKFGTTSAVVTSATATQLVVTVPAGLTIGTPYTINASVSLNNQTSAVGASATQFTFGVPTPTLSSFSPVQASAGASVVINGTNFSTTLSSNAVKFGTTAATVTAATATQLTVTVPASLTIGSTYTISVAITSGNQTSTTASSSTQFTMIVPAPTVTGFSPAAADQGATVTITGTNFSANTSENNVKFGTVSATVTSATATQLVVTVPAGLVTGSSYPISVSVTLSGQTSAAATSISNFTLASLPTITSYTVSGQDEISAPAGGTIGSDGGALVTQRGVCWSVNPNPTINDSHTTDGNGTGPFNSSIKGLTPGATYHVRAYAVNAVGTNYGGDVTFTTTSVIVSSGLIAFYKFDNNALDYSGNKNDLTTNSLNYVSGLRNGSSYLGANFDGSSTFAYTYLNNMNSQSISISYWMYGKSTYNSSVMGFYSGIFYNIDKPGLTEGFYSYCNLPSTSPNSALRNTWTHVAFTYDNTSGTANIYLNGILVNSTTWSTCSLSIFDNSNPFYFAKDITNSPNVLWNGYMDNARIYNRALNASEVTQLYNE